ncbi:MAG: glycosyltransferase [Desulfobacteraceae bacterium]|nr:glycosyltransferase [Desulfobacteraceae bacterium]
MIDKATIVFLRAPEKGKVKTRLSEFLSEAFVLDLYKGFVIDTLQALESTGDKILYYWPLKKKNLLLNFLGNGYTLSCQHGDNIGRRMANAFQDIFQDGYERGVLIGTDIPEISREIIERSFKILETKDAVVGPSIDGGYYLIGFNKTAFSKAAFKNINWSTKHVLDETLDIFNKMKVSYECLPELNDIDTVEDLKALAARVKKGGRAGKRTLEILKDYED